MSGWTAGVPPHCRAVAGWTSHQTEWVILPLRRDPHSKSNHQTSAFTAHRFYLAACVHFMFPLSVFPQRVRECVSLTFLPLFYSFMKYNFIDIWLKEADASRSWRLTGIPTPRDNDVDDILVRHQEVGRRRQDPKRRGSTFNNFFLY